MSTHSPDSSLPGRTLCGKRHANCQLTEGKPTCRTCLHAVPRTSSRATHLQRDAGVFALCGKRPPAARLVRMGATCRHCCAVANGGRA